MGYGPNLYYNRGFNFNKKSEVEEDKSLQFKILKDPSELDQMDIVWNLALYNENPQVIPKAIEFLIKVYTNLDSELENNKTQILEELIGKCMQFINLNKDNTQDGEKLIIRVIEIIKNIIYETEKKGTGDVQPHNAMFKGELFDRIIIKNKATTKRNNFMLSIRSNATIWELKKALAKQVDLVPKYLKLERESGTVIKDLDNGKTLEEVGIQNNEILTATKSMFEDEVPNAPLVGPDGKFTEKAS